VVRDAVGSVGDAVVAQVVAVAGGNPLHAREAAFAAVRSGGGLAPVGSLPELIEDRFARLDRRAQSALALAAACGDAFWPEAVGDALLAGAGALYREGVAQVRMTSAVAGSTEAGWVHPLLHEVAYARLSGRERRSLHAQLGAVLDAAGAAVEVVARQAGQAFRLGDVGSAPLAGRAAAGAAREALDRFALSGAEQWIALVRDSGHEPAVGVADVLDAELQLARGHYADAARLVRPLTLRDDEVGTRALVLAVEATAGAGDLRVAEEFGAKALTRVGNDPQLAASYGQVLARRGRLEEALQLLDASAEACREAGDEAMAARLEAQAADAAADLAEKEGLPFRDAIGRTRHALEGLRTTGDRRRFAQSVDSLFGMVNIDYPHEAMALAKEAADVARSLGDEVAYGRAVYRVCDAALDLCDVDTFEQWRRELDALPLAATQRAEADLLTATFDRARTGQLNGAVEEFIAIADRIRALGESAIIPPATAICAALWSGKVAVAKKLLAGPIGRPLPAVHATLFTLNARVLEGPPWRTEVAAAISGTVTNRELALLHYLRGEREQADHLLIERHIERVGKAGLSFERFTPFFPGPLVAALGPAASDSDRRWLKAWILDAPLPGLWLVHRAIAAVLLAERDDEDRADMARACLALLERAQPDAPVRRWIEARAHKNL
jgi:hypothetical protein